MRNPYTTSVEKIMRLVANLPKDHVEEVFEGVGRMPQITLPVLNRMAKVMSDIFEESREATIVGTRRSTQKSLLASQSLSKRVTRSSLKSKQKAEESEYSTSDEESETDEEDTELEEEEEAEAVPQLPKARVTLFLNYSQNPNFCNH